MGQKPIINGAKGVPSVYRQLLEQIEKRGTKEGVISLNVARTLTTKARVGRDLAIGPAILRIVE